MTNHVGNIFGLTLGLVLLAALSTGAAAQKENTSEGDASDQTKQSASAGSVKSDLPPATIDPDTSLEILEMLLVPLTEEDLAALAAEWRAIVKGYISELADLQVVVASGTDTESEAAREKWLQLTDQQKTLFKKYATVLDAWEEKGADEEDLKKFQRYRTAILTEGIRLSDPQTIASRALSWITDEDGGVAVALKIAIFAVSIFGMILIARIFRVFMRNRIGSIRHISKLLQTFLVTVSYWIIISIGLMFVLSALGVDITPLFALFGGASFILAFAFQDTLGNLASGLMIMINRPFDEGEYVDIGGVAGTVKSVSIVTTTVITPDNKVIVVPNKNVWGNVITNITTSSTRRVDLIFGISYDDSISDAISVMDRTVKAHPLVLSEPEPMIRVHELGDNSVNFICRPWVNTENYWTVYWDLTRQVKEGFDDAGISIPFPQRDIHIKAEHGRHKSLDTGSTPSSQPRTQTFADGDEGHESDSTI